MAVQRYIENHKSLSQCVTIQIVWVHMCTCTMYNNLRYEKAHRTQQRLCSSFSNHLFVSLHLHKYTSLCPSKPFLHLQVSHQSRSTLHVASKSTVVSDCLNSFSFVTSDPQRRWKPTWEYACRIIPFRYFPLESNFGKEIESEGKRRITMAVSETMKNVCKFEFEISHKKTGHEYDRLCLSILHNDRVAFL